MPIRRFWLRRGCPEPDWVIVTSAAGAERVAADVATRPGVRLAAVGTATAQRLARIVRSPARPRSRPAARDCAGGGLRRRRRPPPPRAGCTGRPRRADAGRRAARSRPRGHGRRGLPDAAPPAGHRRSRRDRRCRCGRVRQRIGGTGLGRRRRDPAAATAADRGRDRADDGGGCSRIGAQGHPHRCRSLSLQESSTS